MTQRSLGGSMRRGQGGSSASRASATRAVAEQVALAVAARAGRWFGYDLAAKVVDGAAIAA